VAEKSFKMVSGRAIPFDFMKLVGEADHAYLRISPPENSDAPRSFDKKLEKSLPRKKRAGTFNKKCGKIARELATHSDRFPDCYPRH
jgi:hypothetical protein